MRPHARPHERSGLTPLLALTLIVAAMLAWANAPVAALAVNVPPADRPPADTLPWLTATATRVVDPQNRTVLRRGFNTDALLDYADGPPAPLTPADAQLMAAEGFTVVRLPIAWSRLEPTRGRFDPTYLDLIATTVSMLNAHHLYVVLDMHLLDWGPRFGGSGAPRWAYLHGVPDLHPWPSEPWGRHLSPAQNAAYTYFFTNADWQRDYLQAWQHVAATLRDRSGVAAYDLLNEPHPLPIPPGVFERQFLWPLYAKTVSAIAQVDPNHLFMVEGVLFANAGTPIVPLHARGLIYSQHSYTGSLVPPAFTGNRHDLTQHLDEGQHEATQLAAPFWEGEFGIDHTQAHAQQWADAALDTLDDLDAGWAWWQWRQDGGWGIRDRAGNVNTDDLRHLARPFLAAAPASVHAGRGNGLTGRLEIRVDPSPAATGLTLAWPSATLRPPTVTGCDARLTPSSLGSYLLDVAPTATGCVLELSAPGAATRNT